ncbi:MAG: DUF3078 domain-containing protein [Bacteroidota bacterium]
MKKVLILFFLFFFLLTNYSFAQTMEELKEQQTEKTAELASLETELADLQGKVDALKGEVADLTDKVTPYPRWSTGLLGTLGFNFAGFNNWLARANPSTSATTIGLTGGFFANLQQEKYFWNNGGNLALSWLRFDDNPDDDVDADFETAADAFNVTSLFGYKLNPKLAASALGEYRTTLLDETFNDPGYLDLGVGATWTPLTNLVVVFHPLNYNFVFSEDKTNFESSLGLKTVVDYSANITEGIAWKSNLSTFLSYEDTQLSNWTWINTFSTAYKGIGIGLDIGLRGNRQEANAENARRAEAGEQALDSDNPVQTYFILGLAYNLTSN